MILEAVRFYKMSWLLHLASGRRSFDNKPVCWFGHTEVDISPSTTLEWGRWCMKSWCRLDNHHLHNLGVANSQMEKITTHHLMAAGLNPWKYPLRNGLRSFAFTPVSLTLCWRTSPITTSDSGIRRYVINRLDPITEWETDMYWRSCRCTYIDWILDYRHL